MTQCNADDMPEGSPSCEGHFASRSRRDVLVLGAGAVALAAASPLALSREKRWTVEQMRSAIPIVARHEGVWEGIYRRYDAQGKPLGEHRSRVVIRMRPDPKGGNELLEQSNYYFYPDGRFEEINTLGSFDGKRLNFYSDRVDGWTQDDTTDPNRRTCILVMTFKKDVGWYTKGVAVYEMINISDDGKHRTRMTQHLKDGRALTRTLIDETFRTADWLSEKDWKSVAFAS
jgi:hypothetical protein